MDRRHSMVGLKPADKGIRPIALQGALLKLAENCLLATVWPQLAIAPEQYGVGPGANSHAAIEVLQATADDTRTQAMLSIDVSNAFGSIAHSAVWRALAESAPCLVPYLSSAWQEGAGMELYVKGPSGWETRRCMAGVSQGSPLAPYLYEIASAAKCTQLAAQKFKLDHAFWDRRSAMSTTSHFGAPTHSSSTIGKSCRICSRMLASSSRRRSANSGASKLQGAISPALYPCLRQVRQRSWAARFLKTKPFCSDARRSNNTRSSTSSASKHHHGNNSQAAPQLQPRPCNQERSVKNA